MRCGTYYHLPTTNACNKSSNDTKLDANNDNINNHNHGIFVYVLESGNVAGGSAPNALQSRQGHRIFTGMEAQVTVHGSRVSTVLP